MAFSLEATSTDLGGWGGVGGWGGGSAGENNRNKRGGGQNRADALFLNGIDSIRDYQTRGAGGGGS